MTIEQAIRDYLLANSSVSALISNRLWPMVLDQSWPISSGPAVTYEFISSVDSHTLSGGRVELTQSRIQFVCYAATFAAAMAVARAIRKSGITAIKGLYSGVDIRGVMIEDGIRTDFDPPTDGQAESRYLAEFDLKVSYQE